MRKDNLFTNINYYKEIIVSFPVYLYKLHLETGGRRLHRYCHISIYSRYNASFGKNSIPGPLFFAQAPLNKIVTQARPTCKSWRAKEVDAFHETKVQNFQCDSATGRYLEDIESSGITSIYRSLS